MTLRGALIATILVASAGVAQAQAGFERPTQMLRETVAYRGAPPARPPADGATYAYAAPGPFQIRSELPNPYPAMRIAPTSELQVRGAIEVEAARLLRIESFLTLEKMAEKFRTSDRFTPAGNSKLEAFYEAFRFCHCQHAEEVTAWRARVERYRQTFPKSPTPLVILAGFLIDDAWYGLQNGPGGSTVRRLIYRTALEEADRLLANNWDVVSRDSQAFALLGMVNVSSEADRSVFNLMVDRIAVGAPDYAPAWFSAIDGLSPQWRDDPVLIERTARRATAGGDGEGLYARVLHRAWAASSDDRFFVQAKPDRNLLHASALNFINRHPDVSSFAAMAELACAMRDWEMAEPLFIRLQTLDASSYAAFPAYKSCRRELYERHNPTR